MCDTAVVSRWDGILKEMDGRFLAEREFTFAESFNRSQISIDVGRTVNLDQGTTILRNFGNCLRFDRACKTPEHLNLH
jgi:hypothetical protein